MILFDSDLLFFEFGWRSCIFCAST